MDRTRKRDRRGLSKDRPYVGGISAKNSPAIAGRKYDVKEHPSFADYVSGVLWEAELPVAARFAFLPDYPPEDILALKKRFPPRMLKGMSSWAQWLPPKLHAEEMECFRRRSSNPEVYFNRE
ncbi:MAG: hypothetical protein ACLPTZ_20855 [Beijerinckiaceae bacterium]